MKYYLLSFTLYDGEHEHHDQITTIAKDHDHAMRKGATQEHEAYSELDEENPTMFDFGDGTTGSKCKYAQEITKKEMEVLDRLNVANFYELADTK